MHPQRVFTSNILDKRDICNYCFRRRAQAEQVPDGYPDYVVPQHWPSESSEIEYPPPKADHYIYKKSNVQYGDSYTSDSIVEGLSEKVGQDVRYGVSDFKSGRGAEVGEIISSKPTIVCECAVIDDERINGEFPDDWENRPKEKLMEVGKRVYHRLDEQGFDVDFDIFQSSLEDYKTSDDYSFGDYGILKEAVADSVSVTP